ncbi:hypothetical protein PEC301877_18650 [Pectobacterium carotovorum subsp. carotovorum]|nr:hypothetical protein PEC301877_18650 [Pectobacterium carotovorum subsp. carotovorum]
MTTLPHDRCNKLAESNSGAGDGRWRTFCWHSNWDGRFLIHFQIFTQPLDRSTDP